MSCEHENTHYEGWPDGGTIEVCDVCGLSRYLCSPYGDFEQGDTSWTRVENIEEARREVQESIDGMVSGESKRKKVFQEFV